jgi:hypothetical protein
MFRWWRRIEKLQLWEVLRRRGTRAWANQNPRGLEFAVERCVSCAQVKACERDLLSAEADARLETYCPNTMYLRHLDAMRRHNPPSLTGPDT